jgi:putative Mn2+ efflux pump MntP
MWETVALAFGLAMDCAAVSAVRGARRTGGRDAVVLPLLFGVFHAGMAAIGWLAGSRLEPYIEAWDHWIAFGLLAVIGIKMIVDSLRAHVPGNHRTGLAVYLVLAIATSIDVLAAGLTLPLLPIAPELAIGIIAVVTVACSLGGFLLGRAVASERLGPRLDLVGGLVLIAIGVRILVDHLA